MTLHDMMMEDLAVHSEEVLATKFSRAISEACGVSASRIRVLGFKPGSVKIIFEIEEATPPTAIPGSAEDIAAQNDPANRPAQQILNDIATQMASQTSRLRLGEFGPFVRNAEVEPLRGGGADMKTESREVRVESNLASITASPMPNRGGGPEGQAGQPVPKAYAPLWKPARPTMPGLQEAGDLGTGMPGSKIPNATIYNRTTATSSMLEPQRSDSRPYFATTFVASRPEEKEDFGDRYPDHAAYTFYTKDPQPVEERKFNPYAKFIVTRHPVSVRGPSSSEDGGFMSFGNLTLQSAASWLDGEMGKTTPSFRVPRAEEFGEVAGEVEIEQDEKLDTARRAAAPEATEEEAATARGDRPKSPVYAPNVQDAQEAPEEEEEAPRVDEKPVRDSEPIEPVK